MIARVSQQDVPIRFQSLDYNEMREWPEQNYQYTVRMDTLVLVFRPFGYICASPGPLLKMCLVQ